MMEKKRIERRKKMGKIEWGVGEKGRKKEEKWREREKNKEKKKDGKGRMGRRGGLLCMLKFYSKSSTENFKVFIGSFLFVV